MMRRLLVAFACTTLLVLTACHSSPIFSITVTNASGGNIRQVELDYPGASFGRDNMANGAVVVEKVQFRGSAQCKLSFTDAAGKQHQSNGPKLNEGEGGTMDVRITPGDSVAWLPNITNAQH